MIFNSVRTRIALRYSVLFALLALSIGFGIYRYLQQDAYSRLDDNTRTLLAVARLEATHEMEEHSGKLRGEEALRNVLSTLYQTSFPQEQAAIWDGKRLVAYKPNLGRPQDDLRRIDVGSQSRVFNAGDLRVATSSFYVPQARTTYRIAVSTWLGDTQNDLSAIHHGLELLLPLLFLLTAGTGFYLARRTLAPLTEITQKMDAISCQNLSERITVSSSQHEIVRLTTGFNQLLDRLQTTFQQQQRFMADASHELKTPVAAALTAAQVTLRVPNRTAAQYNEALRIVEEQMLRLRRIVEDMFLLARADTNSMHLRLEEFYLDELLAEACRAMRLLAERAGVTLTLAKPLPEVHLCGDAGLLRQAIIILLDNACKYNRAGGAVHVSLQPNNGDCVLRVSDAGPGIPQEAISHLFERFFRVDAARSRDDRTNYDFGGAGLGLAIGSWIAEQHDGQLLLESTSAAGSTFALHLKTSSRRTARPNRTAFRRCLIIV